jgi:hypothetical protein
MVSVSKTKMNDQVNKVIAAILNAEGLEGGARKKRRGTTHHAGGIAGNIRHNVTMHGGETEADISGGQCGSGYYGRSYGRYMMGGSTEGTVPEVPAEVAPTPEAVTEQLTGGKRSKSRSKRKLPAALKRNQQKVMKIYKDLKKRYPNQPGNELMKKAMKQASRSK